MPAREFHILLIEDNPGDARLTMDAFRSVRRNARVSHVTDGAAALDFLRKGGKYTTALRPNLILLDLNLPRKSGREVLAEIKADSKLRHIPVVVLSTSQDDEDVSCAYGLNANCYVQKPTQLDQFQQVVRCIDEFWVSTAHVPME
jgi:chemotaxis family two-component system response regulator Rcp1